MFTGIVKGMGNVVSFDETNSCLVIDSKVFAEKNFDLGASIAIDGVCLTVSEKLNDKRKILFNLGEETKQKTLLAKKSPQSLVNIEWSLVLGDSLDGHLVQGHTDALVKVEKIISASQDKIIWFSLPKDCEPLIVKKGSIAINGVSLTVNEKTNDQFSVCLIPHTLAHTNLSTLKVFDRVHVETDILGRYVINNLSKYYAA